MMRGCTKRWGILAGLAVALGVSACDEDPVEPTTGAIQVTAATNGADQDADGYTVSVDAGAGLAIDANGAIVIPGITPGARSVALSGIADNCSVDGANPVSANVVGGDTAQVAFTLTCSAPPTGAITVTTSTTGDTLDPDGYTVTVDGSDTPIGINDTVTVADLAAGTYGVTLSGLAGNCSLTDTAAVSATLIGGDTAQVAFGVACVAPPPTGTVVVTTATTGDTLDPDGYQVDVGGTNAAIGINDTIAIELQAGTYTAVLADVAANCSVSDTAGIALTLVGSDTARADFSITCTAPAPAPAQEWIAFTTDRDGNDDVYLALPDSMVALAVTTDAGADAQPALSPDSTRLAFRSERDGNGEIYVVNVDGTGLVNISNDAGDDGSPAWSPDGSQIAWVTDRDGNAEIYVAAADGSGATNLTNDSTGADIDPAWSPDGTQVAFSTDRDGQAEVYVMNADGSGATNLSADTTGADTEPAWSPDGTALTFTTDRDGNAEVYHMAADGSGQTNLTNDAGSDSGSAWSPDGMRIAFSTDRDGNLEVYLMAADGSGPVNVTQNAAADRHPHWGVARR